MNKLTKGALAMVLMGSITFSVTNALFADHSSKQVAQASAITNSNDQKKADDTNHSSNLLAQANAITNTKVHKTSDNYNQTEKMVKDKTSTPDVKNVQTTPTPKIAALEVVSKNGNESDKAVAAIQKKMTTKSVTLTTVNTIAPTTSNSRKSNIPATGSTSTKSNAATVPTTSTKTASTATTTKSNHGKQVSQAAKVNASIHKKKTMLRKK